MDPTVDPAMMGSNLFVAALAHGRPRPEVLPLAGGGVEPEDRDILPGFVPSGESVG
jgi:hypothetical protein